MADELLIRLRDALVGTCAWTDAGLAADVRERLARLNLLVLPGPQPMETAPKDGTCFLIFGDCRLEGIVPKPGEEDPDWYWARWLESNAYGGGGYWYDGSDGWLVGAKCWTPLPPIPDAATLRRIAKGATPEMIANDHHPNEAPKWAGDGTLLDGRGERSIFDDVDE